MSEPIYVSRSSVRKIEGTHRRARLEGGIEFEFGVHGPVKRYFRLDDQKDLPLPVDYIVAATAG